MTNCTLVINIRLLSSCISYITCAQRFISLNIFFLVNELILNIVSLHLFTQTLLGKKISSLPRAKQTMTFVRWLGNPNYQEIKHKESPINRFQLSKLSALSRGCKQVEAIRQVSPQTRQACGLPWRILIIANDMIVELRFWLLLALGGYQIVNNTR